MLVVTRLRAPEDPAALADFRAGLERAQAVLASARGYVGGVVGRNVDDPGLWVLETRWENVGSYRRAIGSYDAKMHVQPFMVHALDEPSAYETVTAGESLNESVPRETR